MKKIIVLCFLFLSINCFAEEGIQNQVFTMGWSTGNINTTLQEMVDDAFGKQEWCSFSDLLNVLKTWNSEIGEGYNTGDKALWQRQATEWLENAMTVKMNEWKKECFGKLR